MAGGGRESYRPMYNRVLYFLFIFLLHLNLQIVDQSIQMNMLVWKAPGFLKSFLISLGG